MRKSSLPCRLEFGNGRPASGIRLIQHMSQSRAQSDYTQLRSPLLLSQRPKLDFNDLKSRNFAIELIGASKTSPCNRIDARRLAIEDGQNPCS